MKIYAASLTDYAAGILHGCWIDLEESTDMEDIRTQLDAMLKVSPTAQREGRPAEEIAIHDTKDAPTGLGEISLDKAIEVQDCLDALARHWFDDPLDILEAWIDCHGPWNPLEASEIIDNYKGQYDDEEALAYEYAEDSGLFEGVADTLRLYFDFKAYGRDLCINHFIMAQNGHTFYR